MDKIIRERKLIKDVIWGSVAILPWEQSIVDHPVFARLHNVLQNSSAYRVYPGLRVSRFSHSIGVAHVLTQIFQAALLQRENDGLFKPKIPESTSRQKPISSTATRRRPNSLQAEAENLTDAIPVELAGTLVSTARRIFPLHHNNGDQANDAFYILHAILRVAALLHDIGHLPYSHIFEFALGSAIRGTIKWKARRKCERIAKSAEFVKLVNSAPIGKLHEFFGKQLMAFMGRDFQEDLWRPHLEYLISCASRILHTKDFPIAKSFISGDMDADRIDFVRRDTHFSGLLQTSVDYSRLFAFYEIQKAETADSATEAASRNPQAMYVATPGIRSLSDAEKVLWERFQDYKYIACHHRVHLNDELLERCIIELTQAGCLQNLFECMLRLSQPNGTEPSTVRRMLSQTSNLMALLTEFDDAWLDIQMRTLYKQIISGVAEELPERAQRLLIAYVEGTSCLESAFHSDHAFWEYCEKHYPSLYKLLPHAAGNHRQKSEVDELKHQASILEDLSLRINEKKREWEEELFAKYNQLIVIGEVCNKLKIGFAPNGKRRYQSLSHLSNLHDFLSVKVMETMPFNFWFPKGASSDLVEDVFNYIRDESTKVSDLLGSID